MVDLWLDLPWWMRVGFAVLLLLSSTVLYFMGYFWPWGWGVGAVLLPFSFSSSDQ